MAFTEDHLTKVQNGLEELLAEWKQDILSGNFNEKSVEGSVISMMKEIYENIRIDEFNIRRYPDKGVVKLLVVTNVGFFKAINPKLPMEKLSIRPYMMEEN